ncbi:hypothetical protein QX233_17840 [Chryseobacterium gambrini]|uniref:Uncharacterized protein n=1 Tax=Chryseobacterium gambrini TaxID=373672 RepID=A0AAJ1R5D0_9FLAO|nr:MULTISPECIES: hypothetical protein [Chryseobacterium]MDN4014336.1 hypothetical protein [Chryseobacterium gambrini]MDN4028212.1 hypothetical protein [Chryseobacterium gambrini]QWA39921.1 hypothetical protein KKI44_06860 [Chryseobacterium sp. ZHDP1]
MEKESIITISQTHQKADFNWAIKRYLPNFKDRKSTIIGVQFPWKKIFEDVKNFNEISQNITDLYNEFTGGNFFKSINYTPQFRDVFILKTEQFSGYYWIEFIFTKNKWNLKTKNYSWENETFVYANGLNKKDDFIVSKISYEVLFFSFRNPVKDENGYRKRKYRLPVYINDEDYSQSNYIFYFSKSDGLRRDLRVRSVRLLIDEDFDYYLHICSNEFSESSGRKLDFVNQGQIPLKILFQFLKTVHENNTFGYYGGGAILDLPETHFIFKIKDKIHKAGILSHSDKKTYDLENLQALENTILEWIDKVIEFQKQN